MATGFLCHVCRIELIVLKCLLFIHVNGELHDTNAVFMGAIHRYSTSQYYDLYYCCNTCGRAVAYSIERDRITFHNQDDAVGHVHSQLDAQNVNVRYTSTLISKRMESNTACMDSVLVISQQNPSFRPLIICRSTRPGDRSVTIPYNNDNNITEPGNVKEEHGRLWLNHAIDNGDVVISPSNLTTQILTCSTSELQMGWNSPEGHRISIDNSQELGHSDITMGNVDTYVSFEAILIGRSPELTSILLVTQNFSRPVNVTCSANGGSVGFPLVKPVVNAEEEPNTEAATKTIVPVEVKTSPLSVITTSPNSSELSSSSSEWGSNYSSSGSPVSGLWPHILTVTCMVTVNIGL